MPAIETRDLRKSFGAIEALRGVTLSVEKGEIVGLLGPNGAGKTTLMRVLTGYLQPDSGAASVLGLDVVSDPLAVQRRIGYLPESAPLYGEMAVQEYLLYMAALRDVAEADRPRLLSDAVHAAGLREHLTRPIGKLSKGYRQRVGIAQAILHRPELLVLDEPTSGLDPTQIVEIRDLIRGLATRSTVLLSTHILSEVELTCDRVLVIIGGRLRADSRLADLRAAGAAIVTLVTGVDGARAALEGLAGVRRVDELPPDGQPGRRYRVTADGARDLCPAIYDLARTNGWRLAELRPDTRTLEAVFRELAATPGRPEPAPEPDREGRR